MGRKQKRSWKLDINNQEVKVFFSQNPEKRIDFKTKYIQNFCTWTLDDFVRFVRIQASQDATCCCFMIRDKENYEAIQRLNTELVLRGIPLPIPVKIVSPYE